MYMTFNEQEQQYEFETLCHDIGFHLTDEDDERVSQEAINKYEEFIDEFITSQINKGYREGEVHVYDEDDKRMSGWWHIIKR